MRYLNLAICAFFITTTLQAGILVITKTGASSTEPEFVELRVEIASQCYNKASDAQKKTEELANKVAEVFKEYDTKEAQEALGDKVFVNARGRYYKQAVMKWTGSSETKVCKGEWRGAKSVSLKLVEMDALPDIQDKVLAIIDAAAPQDAPIRIRPPGRPPIRPLDTQLGSEDSGSEIEEFEPAVVSPRPGIADLIRQKPPTTTASWKAPNPTISSASREELKVKAGLNAQELAKKEAIAQVKACGGTGNLNLVGIAEPSTQHFVATSLQSATMESGDAGLEFGGGQAAPAEYSFDDIEERVTKVFTFEYEGGTVCKLTPTETK